MARLVEWNEGAETSTLFWDTLGGVTRTTTTKRAPGRASFVIPSGGPGYKNLTTPLGEFYFRMALYYYSGSSSNLLTFYDNISTPQCYLQLDTTTSLLKLYSGANVLLATGSIPLYPLTWYCIEVHLKVHSSTGAFDVRVDEVSAMAFSGDTRTAAAATVALIGFGAGSSGVLIDDLGLNDTTGGVDDSWLGDGHIIAMAPTANGTTNQYTPSAGTNWENVDEIPNDGDTTYNENSTAGNQDMYAVEDWDATGWTVRSVWAEGIIRGTAAAEQCKVGIKSGATTSVSAAKNLLTTYRRVVGDEHKTDPDTAAAWDNAGMDAVEFVVETV